MESIEFSDSQKKKTQWRNRIFERQMESPWESGEPEKAAAAEATELIAVEGVVKRVVGEVILNAADEANRPEAQHFG